MDDEDEHLRKLSWHNGIAFIIFWLMVYVFIAVPKADRLPPTLTTHHESSTQFTAERARNVLRAITNVGARMVGSDANEITTIEVLKAEVDFIKRELRRPFRQRLDIDVQLASGNFSIEKAIFTYSSIQNFIVKLSPFKSATNSCLLVNSHFDTVHHSPGAGDAAAMVAIMLEILLVLTKSQQPLNHAVVFLFNGADEAGWLGSHAFLTQHKWAKDCKVFINLGSAGWGGQLLLVQAAPIQSLLLQYYKQVPNPIASAVFEELFSTNLVLSNTDFHMFRKFASMPGYDMALISNGYIHHTKFDYSENYSYNSLQFAGDNILALIRYLSNDLEELDKTLQITDKMIYYDFFGNFLMLYSEHFGALLNFSVCIIAGIAICLSLFKYAANCELTFKEVMSQYVLIMLVQIFSLILGTSVAILVSAILSTYKCSLCWYSNRWLLLGLYFCPMFFGMLALPALTIKHIDYKCNRLIQHVRLLMHAHCTWLMVLTLLLTLCGVRSAYLSMIAVAFYALAVWANLFAEWHFGGVTDYWFLVPIIVSQIIPFTYFTSLAHVLYKFLVPLMGRIGYKFNSEFLMAAVAIVMSSLFAGFILPIFLYLKKSLRIAFFFLTITLFCIFLANTTLGFPFKAETAPQRFDVVLEHYKFANLEEQQTKFYSLQEKTPLEQSAIRVQISDHTIQNLNDFKKIFPANKEICYLLDSASTFILKNNLNFHIPIAHGPSIMSSCYPKLQVAKISRYAYSAFVWHTYYFQLSGPNYMDVKVSVTNAKIVLWSFDENGGDFSKTLKFASGRNNMSYEFDITFKCTQTNASRSNAYFEIGIYGQWYDEQENYKNEFRSFIDAFPVYAVVDDSLATYELWRFEL